MSQFILIDQSLSGAGGHHYECAQLLLAAAEKQGWTPVVAAHRTFQGGEDWPARWPITRVFRDTAYHRLSVITGVATRPFNPFETWTNDLCSSAPWWRYGRWHDSVAGVMRRLTQRRRLQSQIRSLQSFWNAVQPRRGDVAFLQTVNEYDLVWFCRFLAETPGTDQIDWHLQFHNNFLQGRDALHARQADRTVEMQRHFWSLLQHFPRHRLHFYCTTAAMLRQFAALGAAPFEVLECPAHPHFAAAAEQARVTGPFAANDRTRTLRVVCGGYGRQEKGWSSLATIVDESWSDLFESGRCELWIQASASAPSASRRRLKRRRLRVQPALMDASNSSVNELEQVIAGRMAKSGDATSLTGSPVRRQPYPLPPEAYRCFLSEADIGLFPYDAQRYFARYSAVLVEMLCAGVPVIVPAATWLAEQVAEANQRHCRDLCGDGDVLGSATPGNGEFWRLPSSAAELAIHVRGVETPPGAYAQTSVVQRDAAGRELDRCLLVNRPLPGEETWISLVRVAAGASRVAVEVTDLDAGVEWDVDGERVDHGERWRLARLDALAPTADWPLGRPLGAVGLTAADEREFGRQLREMCRFHAHYQTTARRFAAGFAARHTGEAILEQLFQRSLPVSAKGERKGADARNVA